MRNSSYLCRLFSRRDFPFDLKRMLFYHIFFQVFKGWIPLRVNTGELVKNLDETFFQFVFLFHLDTGHKLNAHKTFRRRPGRLLNVSCKFNLRPLSSGFHCEIIQDIFSIKQLLKKKQFSLRLKRQRKFKNKKKKKMHETFLKVSIIPRLSQVDLKKHTIKYEFFFIIGVQKQYFVCVLKKNLFL